MSGRPSLWTMSRGVGPVAEDAALLPCPAPEESFEVQFEVGLEPRLISAAFPRDEPPEPAVGEEAPIEARAVHVPLDLLGRVLAVASSLPLIEAHTPRLGLADDFRVVPKVGLGLACPKGLAPRFVGEGSFVLKGARASGTKSPQSDMSVLVTVPPAVEANECRERARALRPACRRSAQAIYG